MKTLSRLSILALPLIIAAGCAQAQGTGAFHPAQTDAEKTMLTIFDAQKSGGDIFRALRDYKHGKGKRKVLDYAPLVTNNLAKAVEKTDDSIEGQQCLAPDGKTAFTCPMTRTRTFDVVFCAQNYPESPVFRTLSDNGARATVSYTWDGTTDHAKYNLVKIKGLWRLDGVECAKTGKKYNVQ